MTKNELDDSWHVWLYGWWSFLPVCPCGRIAVYEFTGCPALIGGGTGGLCERHRKSHPSSELEHGIAMAWLAMKTNNPN